MNKYRVTTFSYGNSDAYIVAAACIQSALQCGQFNATEVIKIEFIGSANEIDLTEG